MSDEKPIIGARVELPPETQAMLDKLKDRGFRSIGIAHRRGTTLRIDRSVPDWAKAEPKKDSSKE